MREILVRGKKYKTSVFDKTDWVYGSLIDSGNHEQVAIYPWIDGASTMSVRQLVYSRMEAVKPETVGQFTGLHDKNGKEIFEGDIIQHGERKGRIFYYGIFGMFMISWIPNGGANNFMNVLHTEVDVIGNIHDNPELLDGGKGNA